MGEPRATDDYSYVKSIKNTDEMGISSRGSLKQIGKNVGGLISYIELLVEGKGRAKKELAARSESLLGLVLNESSGNVC